MSRQRRIYALSTLLLIASLAPAARAEDAPADTSAPFITRAEVQALLDGMQEQVQVLHADTDKLKRFKFSGYIQTRAEIGEASNDTVKVSGSPATITPANLTRFYIRRARLKLTYDSSPLSQAVVYFDGGQDRTIRLLEAYVTLLDPWTPLHDHQLTIGQINVPFGYEIERSSSVRELPERSRAENVLFSGERDRGAKLVSQWTPQLQTTLAMLNGGGINSADFPATDPTRNKDLLARARWSQGTFDVAASTLAGRQPVALTGPDVSTKRTRIGIDAQAFYPAPVIGGGSLRAEYYAGKDANADSLKALIVSPTSANPVRLLKAGANPDHLATDFVGWYVMWVQNVGERAQLAARFDAFDPNVDVDHDQFTRFGGGVNLFFDGYTRITIAYDVPRTDVAAGGGRFTDPHDNLWTFQLQHKF